MKTTSIAHNRRHYSFPSNYEGLQFKGSGHNGHSHQTGHQSHRPQAEPKSKTDWVKEPHGRRGTGENPE